MRLFPPSPFLSYPLIAITISQTVCALDLDGDGMSDVWQRTHSISTGDTDSDPDGDGWKNAAEAARGTDPHDSSDFFKTTQFSFNNTTDTVDISWRSLELMEYSIQESSDLVNWVSRGDYTGVLGTISQENITISSPPSNDNFESRLPTSAVTTQTAGTNVDATKETSEPIFPSVAVDNTVWWTWSSATTVEVTITTNGSDYDTTLAIYTGDTFSNLVLVDSDDDGGEGTRSSITFTASAGIVYSIQVSGYQGDTGQIILNHPISSGVFPQPVTPPSKPPRKFYQVVMNTSFVEDADGDQLMTWEERLFGSDPFEVDGDSDNMSDLFEFIHQFNPTSAVDGLLDADSDGLTNAQEEAANMDPHSDDSNNNGVLDGLEDTDFDGLTTLQEFANNTDPLQPDTDLDGLFDGWEIANAYDPTVDNSTDSDPDNDASADPDGDGVLNYQEADHGTLAREKDSDGDGVEDNVEISQGSNPNDPNDSTPPPSGTTPVNITFGDPSGSHSEKYRVTLTPIEGDTSGHSKRFRTNRSYGVPQTDTFHLPKGAKYTIELTHVGTDPNYNSQPNPDYDYDLVIDTTNGCLAVVDPQGITGSHSEGTVFFANGKSATLHVPLFEWITPKGSPVSAPDDVGDGQNEFTYSTAAAGVLSVNMKVLVKPTGTAALTGHDGVKFSDRCVFSLPAITGSTFAWNGANTGGVSSVSGEHLIAAATYTNLPTSNSSFGAKQADFTCDTHASPKADFEVFFPKNATNNPGGTDPNWFYYWKQFIPTGRIASLSFGGTGYGSTNPVNRTTTVGQLASEFNDETMNRGIHTFYETVEHESHHIVLWEGWWGVGGLPTAALDTDNDTYPDSFETSTVGVTYGFAVGQNDDYVNGVNSTAAAPRWPNESAGYNYEEDLCRQEEHNLNSSAFDAQDWSHDSTNTNQGKNHK